MNTNQENEKSGRETTKKQKQKKTFFFAKWKPFYFSRTAKIELSFFSCFFSCSKVKTSLKVKNPFLIRLFCWIKVKGTIMLNLIVHFIGNSQALRKFLVHLQCKQNQWHTSHCFFVIRGSNDSKCDFQKQPRDDLKQLLLR